MAKRNNKKYWILYNAAPSKGLFFHSKIIFNISQPQLQTFLPFHSFSSMQYTAWKDFWCVVSSILLPKLKPIAAMPSVSLWIVWQKF
jgi:hypothetical protein